MKYFRMISIKFTLTVYLVVLLLEAIVAEVEVVEFADYVTEVKYQQLVDVVEVTSEFTYKQRHSKYRGQPICVFYFNREELQDDLQEKKEDAAREFHNANVETGTFLVVRSYVLSDKYRQEINHRVIQGNYIEFELENKNTILFIDNKEELGNRFNFQGEVYVLYHKYDKECKRKNGKPCLESKVERVTESIRDKVKTQCIKTELLVVDAQTLHLDNEYFKGVCKSVYTEKPAEKFPILHREVNSRLCTIYTADNQGMESVSDVCLPQRKLI